MIAVVIALIAGLLLLLTMWPNSSKEPTRVPEKSEGLQSAESYYEDWIHATANLDGFFQLWTVTSASSEAPESIREMADINRMIETVGPNMTLVIVEQLRRETDSGRLRRALALLNIVSRVDLYSQSHSKEVSSHISPELEAQLRDTFVQAWDTGFYDSIETGILEHAVLLEGPIDNPTGRISFVPFYPITQHGVFCLPMVLTKLGQTNSVKALAVFLSAARVPSYSTYSGEYLSRSVTHESKIDVVRNWWAENHHKYDQLHPLYEKIDAAVKALPEYPEEQAPEN
jgi:hypothetical protein